MKAWFLALAGVSLAWMPLAADLRVESQAPLNFGRCLAVDGTFSLTVDPAGAGAGRLAVAGPPGAAFTVRFTPASLRFPGAGLSAFVARCAAGGWVLDDTGHAEIQVGATLRAQADASGVLPAAFVWVTVEAAGRPPVSAALAVHARFVPALRITEERAMDFGRILAPGEAASVRLEPDGRLAPQGRVFLGPGGGSAARFAVSGEPGATFRVVLPGRAWLTGPGEALELADFRIGPGPLVLPGGTARVAVGATLRVKAGQAPGSYRGTYPVLFAYE